MESLGFLGFLCVFAVMWAVVTSLLMVISGWLTLSPRFPDCAEPPIRTLRWQSGKLGLMHMSSVLKLDACATSLRVAMPWVFMGPLGRPFFVPWDRISVAREASFFGPRARITLGGPDGSVLEVSAAVADILGDAVGASWPEGPITVTKEQEGQAIFKEWLIGTLLAGAFFSIAPRLLVPGAEGTPLLIAFGFPAVVFGILSGLKFSRQRKGR